MKLFLTLLLGVCSVAHGQTLRANTKVVLPDSTRDIASRLSDTLSVKDYGAKADGATDDTVAINAALTAGAGKVITVPAGNYAINGSVTVPASTVLQIGPGTYTLGNLGQIKLAGTASKLLCTGGPENTVLVVPSSYTVTDGVIALTSGEPAGTVEGCGISFTQPDVSNRASLTQYAAAAIYMQSQPRAQILNCKITRAWNGIDMRGNSGGSVIRGLQMSSFNIGINIDGSFDTVRVEALHWWPFGGLTTNQTSLFFNSANTGISSGRADDLIIADGLFLGGTAVSTFSGTRSGAEGPTTGTITGTAFDSFNGLAMTAGNLGVSGAYFSLSTGYTAINMTGGNLALAGVSFWGAGGTSFINMTGGQAQASGGTWDIPASMTLPIHMNGAGAVDLRLSGILFNIANDQTIIRSDGGTVDVIGCRFSKASNVANVNPVILFTSTSARGIIADNRSSDIGTGSIIFFKALADSWIFIHDNLLLGSTVSLPGSPTSIFSHDNH